MIPTGRNIPKGPVILILAVLLGASLRIVSFWRDPVVGRDATLYLRVAEASVSNKESLKYYVQGPLLLLAIRAGHGCGLSWKTSGIVVNVAAGTLLILAVWLLCRALFASETAALAAALLTACNPRLIALSREIQRESLYLLFFTTALFLLVKAIEKKSRSWWIAAGCAWGGAASSRFEALEMILFMAGMIFFLSPKEERTAQFRRSLWIFCGFIPALLLIYYFSGLPFGRFADSVWRRLARFW